MAVERPVPMGTFFEWGNYHGVIQVELFDLSPKEFYNAILWMTKYIKADGLISSTHWYVLREFFNSGHYLDGYYIPQMTIRIEARYVRKQR